MLRLRLWHWSAVLAFLLCAGMGTAQTTSTHPLTIENLIDIKHPSNPVWSPDGKRIAFLWDRADIVNLYLVNADGSGAPVALTSFPDGKVTDVFWSKDGTTVYFSRGADLWQVAANGGGDWWRRAGSLDHAGCRGRVLAISRWHSTGIRPRRKRG